jgi:hypothetical protein
MKNKVNWATLWKREKYVCMNKRKMVKKKKTTNVFELQKAKVPQKKRMINLKVKELNFFSILTNNKHQTKFFNFFSLISINILGLIANIFSLKMESERFKHLNF